MGKHDDESWADYNLRASLSSDASDRMQYSDGDDDDPGCGEILMYLVVVVAIFALLYCCS